MLVYILSRNENLIFDKRIYLEEAYNMRIKVTPAID